MTGPVTTEALVEALAPALWQIRIGLPGGLPANSWEETLRAAKALPGGQAAWDVARIKGEASAILAGPLAPLFAALQQVTAERDEARAKQAVPLTEEQLETRRNRAHEAIVRRLQSERDTATSELARLRIACVAIQKSIARFPGSVHDRAMAKIDKALGVVPPDFVDPDEVELARLRAEGEGLREDAGRFRALMRCGRIKVQGSCGVDADTGALKYPDQPGSVHFGAEFWPQGKGEPDRITTWGRHCIRALADDILALEGNGCPAPQDVEISQAAADVLAERRRQVSSEGWTPEHDDTHSRCEMASAAACYATAPSPVGIEREWVYPDIPKAWP